MVACVNKHGLLMKFCGFSDLWGVVLWHGNAKP